MWKAFSYPIQSDYCSSTDLDVRQVVNIPMVNLHECQRSQIFLPRVSGNWADTKRLWLISKLLASVQQPKHVSTLTAVQRVLCLRPSPRKDSLRRSQTSMQQVKVLLPRAKIARETLPQVYVQYGGRLDVVDIYEKELVDTDQDTWNNLNVIKRWTASCLRVIGSMSERWKNGPGRI